MVEIHCKYCKRFLGNAHGTVITEIKCSNSKCKKMNQVKIVNSTSTPEQLRYKFPTPVEKPSSS